MTRVIAICSGKGGAGKTTVTANLGARLAQMGKSVVVLDLLGNADIVLVDVAAGLGREALSAMEASDELILVVNPEMTSVTDALKAAKLAEQVGTKVLGVVLNKVRGLSHEMKTDDIRLMLDGMDVLAEIPEDIDVQRSIAARTPVEYHSPRSEAAYHLRKLASGIAGEKFTERQPVGRRLWRAFFGRK